MEAKKIVALLCAFACLEGCGSAVARLPDPNQQEAQKGLVRLLDAAGHSFMLKVPDGQPTQCSPGKAGDVEVRTCKVCAATLYIDNRGFGSWSASVKREVFDIAFKRGQSFDQPDISPPDGSSGVWVAIVPTQSGPFAPPRINRSVQGTVDIDYPTAARILGMAYERRAFGRHLFWDQNGYVNSSAVLDRLKNLSGDSLISMVGACSAG